MPCWTQTSAQGAYCFCEKRSFHPLPRLSPVILKAGINEETLLLKKIVPRVQKMLLENLKTFFLLSRRRFCVFNVCCIGVQTRKHLGNTEEALTLNVSRMFPHLRILATYFEDREFASQK